MLRPFDNTHTLLDTLFALVREGGRIAMRHHGRLGKVEMKADNSPLTAADLEVDAYLCAKLAEAFPDVPIVTEERAESHAPDKACRRFFLVDPIDGTKEFVQSRGEFTVNVALIEDGVPMAGAVCAPAAGRMFGGMAGRGAFEMEYAGAGMKTLKPGLPDNEALAIVASRSHLTPETEAFIRSNKIGRFTKAGSSLKFCLLAAGAADLYPRFGPTMEWDTAAGHAVLLACGGKVEEISGVPLKYGKPGYRNPDFIAYTPGTLFKRQAA